MKRLLAGLSIIISCSLYAQQTIVSLYDGPAPGSENWTQKEVRIGLMGFSAGGIITMGVALHHDTESRPDFIAPIYGFALDTLVVPGDAAPMFFTCAADDGIVALHAPELYTAWLSAGKSIEFHVYSKGGHGFGMRKRGLPIDNWIGQFGEWLNAQGFLQQ